MDVWMIVLRTIFVYFLILMVVHLLGKRAMAKLSLFDLLIGFMIAHLAVTSIENVNTPMLTSLLPIIVLLLLRVTLSSMSSISQKWRHMLEGNSSLNLTKSEHSSIDHLTARSLHFPIILIKDGHLLHENMDKLGKNDFWLKAELKKRIGLTNFKHVSFCSIDGYGHWYIDVKDYLPQK